MDEPLSDTELEFAVGVIVEVEPDLRCRVRLDDGRVVAAVIPRSTAREMFRVVPGNRVQVTVLEGYSLVVGFLRRITSSPPKNDD
jgi:translation initiation factor IF-1